jgi:hypothetical protein
VTSIDKGGRVVAKEVRRGELVKIHRVVLAPEERAPNIPKCTKRVPYEVWIKGFLLDEGAKIGDTVSIETFIGRVLSGRLVAIKPAYEHGFGNPPVNLITASFAARKRIQEKIRNANR